MKQKLFIAGMMFALSTVATAAGMGAGNMGAADKTAMRNKMNTMSAADKAAMRASMGAGNMGGSSMSHGTSGMGKGAAGKRTMGGKDMQGNQTGSQHGATPATPETSPVATPAAQAQ